MMIPIYVTVLFVGTIMFGMPPVTRACDCSISQATIHAGQESLAFHLVYVVSTVVQSTYQSTLLHILVDSVAPDHFTQEVLEVCLALNNEIPN